jgi:cobalt/nickel transport protein
MTRRSVWMLLGVALLVVLPLLKGGEFGGADSEVAALIEATDGFATWFDPIWEPPSGEIESLLFSLQAALGALVVGYAIGRAQGRRRPDDQTDGATPPRG